MLFRFAQAISKNSHNYLVRCFFLFGRKFLQYKKTLITMYESFGYLFYFFLLRICHTTIPIKMISTGTKKIIAIMILC